MYTRELEMISAFSDIFGKDNWNRICAVFWIRGMDHLFWKNVSFGKDCVNLNKTNDYSFMYSLDSVTDLKNEIMDAPLFETLNLESGTIHVLCDLFLWSVLIHKDSSFGNGFGGIEKMRASRLDF